MGVSAKHTVILALLKHLEIHGAVASYPDVMNAARPLFDTALTANLGEAHDEGHDMASLAGATHGDRSRDLEQRRHGGGD